jgi:hypothetical protein
MIAGLAVLDRRCFANVASVAFFGDCASLTEYKDVTL